MKNVRMISLTLLLAIAVSVNATAAHEDRDADASAAQTVPARLEPGSGSFMFSDPRGNTDKPIKVWYYKPESLKPDSPLLFVMHGSGRDADRYLSEWIPYAEAYSFLLVCPEFSKRHYPGSRMYNLGNMFTAKGAPVEKSKWTFSAIEHLFDYLKTITDLERDTYRIYGHSAGGQFVHRFVLFLPEAPVDTAVAANSGWYTMPTFERDFPYGLDGSGLSEENLERAFSKRLFVLVGNRDVLMDEGLRKTWEVLQDQGVSRMERGSRFYRTAHAETTRLGASLNWRREVVQGSPHDNMQMAPKAAKLLFGSDPQSGGRVVDRERTGLRSQYKTLKEVDVVSMLKKHNLYDSQRNAFGEFDNHYEVKTIQGDKVVVDEATGLMWHPSGSSHSMLIGEVSQWLDDLNAEGYAGHHDWRLPTLEEAASLLESGKLIEKSNLDPLFSATQRYIWTGDSSTSPKGVWMVFFRHGSVGKSLPLYVGYVRPLRSVN